MFSVVGIAVTVLFGILSIIVAIKWKYPGEITFYKEDLIDLYSSVVKNMSDLKITYKETEIVENMFLIRGFIFNSGQKDIHPTSVGERLRIKLSKESLWHDAKIISSSSGVSSKLKISDNELFFDFGLFKRKEHIYFEALVEAPKNNTLKSKLNFQHRIADVGNVKQENLSNFSDVLKNSTYQVLLILTIFLGLLFMSPLELKTFHLEPRFYVGEKLINKNEIEEPTMLLRVYDMGKKVLNEYSLVSLIRIKETKKYRLSENLSVSDNLYVTFRACNYMVNMIFGITFSILFLWLIVSFINNYLRYYSRKHFIEIAQKEIKNRSSTSLNIDEENKNS